MNMRRYHSLKQFSKLLKELSFFACLAL